jgi:hypothetical protein
VVKTTTRKTGALPSQPSRSTLWRRTRGEPSQRDKAAKQQYLTPCEENALIDYVLRMSEPWISSTCQIFTFSCTRDRASAFLRFPDSLPSTMEFDRRARIGQQGFYKRHPEARRVKALDWARHDHDKVTHWFTVISKELHKRMQR